MSKTQFTAEELIEPGDGALWPRFLLFPVAILGYVGFVMGWGGESLMVKLAWSVSLGLCWFWVSGSFHESAHQTRGRWRNANIGFGRVVGTVIGTPYSAYRETHIRHHAYLNTAKDDELWPYSMPGASLAFRRAFVVFDILSAVLASPVVYGRIYFVQNSPISAQARATITREYIALAAFRGTVLLTVMALSLSGTVDLWRFDPMWLLPIPIASAFNAFRKFTEHWGMASTDPILGTRTVIGDNWVTRMCSDFNFEEYVHGPYHRFPQASHFELEAKLAEFRRKPPDAVVPLFSTYRAALWDTLPCLWWNPGVGENARGKNQSHLPPGVDHFVSEVGSQPVDSEVRRGA